MTFDNQLTSFINSEQRRVLRYIQRSLKCSLESAEDVLYDAVESAIKYKNSYKDGLDFAAYIVGIVKKFIWKITHPMAASVKKRIETIQERYNHIKVDAWLFGPIYIEDVTIFGLDENTPEVIIINKERQAILTKFLTTLKPKQQEAAYHYLYNDKTTLSASQLKSNWWALIKSMESIKWNAINLTWSW